MFTQAYTIYAHVVMLVLSSDRYVVTIKEVWRKYANIVIS